MVEVGLASHKERLRVALELLSYYPLSLDTTSSGRSLNASSQLALGIVAGYTLAPKLSFSACSVTPSQPVGHENYSTTSSLHFDASSTSSSSFDCFFFRASRRCLRIFLRSRSLIPPQMPNFSPISSAYSPHSSFTGQRAHTDFASRVDSPRSG